MSLPIGSSPLQSRLPSLSPVMIHPLSSHIRHLLGGINPLQPSIPPSSLIRPIVGWKIADLDHQENDESVDLSDLSEVPYPQAIQKDQLYAEFLAEVEGMGSGHITTARAINEMNGSLDQAKSILQQGVNFVLSSIQIFDYNAEERFELAKFSIGQDLITTLLWLEKFKLSEEHRSECFKLALEQNADYTIKNIRRFDLNKELQFSCLKFALQQYSYKITGNIADSFEHVELNKEEIFDLFKLSLESDVFETASAIKLFDFHKEKKVELFKLSLQQSVCYTSWAISSSNLSEEERFELALFAVEQDIPHTLKVLFDWFRLNALDREAIENTNLTIEPQIQQLILQSNIEKGANAPFCLILQTECDSKKAFHTPSELDAIKEIGKTHKIAFTIINHANIRQEIVIAKQKAGKLLDVLILKGHGQQNSIHFAEGENYYRSENVSVADFEDVHPNGIIILDACSTGAINGLAQKISEVFNGIVFAPIEPTASLSILRIEGELEVFCHDNNGKKITRQFKNGIRLSKHSTQLLAYLRSKEDDLRTAEENYLLGQDYCDRKSVATRRGLPIVASNSHLMALKYFDQARRQGHNHARRSFFYLKYSHLNGL